MRSHRRKPTRLPSPWDPPGKNTGVGCHFLLQCMKMKSESEVAQLCLTPSDPMDCSLPGSSTRGIFEARVLEWGAIAFSVSNFRRTSSHPPLLRYFMALCVCVQMHHLSDQSHTPRTGILFSISNSFPSWPRSIQNFFFMVILP